MPAQLWETTLDPTRRLLKQLRVEDAAEANVVFSSLMGARVSQKDVAFLCWFNYNNKKIVDPSFYSLRPQLVTIIFQVDYRKELIQKYASSINLEHLDI